MNTSQCDYLSTDVLSVPKFKPIFILWFQGWGKAPPICKMCVRSWREMNPDWQVVLLDCNNLASWCDWRSQIPDLESKRISKAAASDVVRLSLLRKFGGVWADATLFCAKPLDEWLALSSHEPFFAFENADPQKRVSSWFLSATIESKLLKRWHEESIRYWTAREKAHNYFWVHRIFAKLCDEDQDFYSRWQRCIKISNVAPHFFYKVGFSGKVTPAIERHIGSKSSPVYKLTWKKGPIHKCARIQLLRELHFGRGKK